MSCKINKGVIFDFDGVLVDTGEYHRLAWYDLADREGLKFSDEFFCSTFGMQNYQILPEMTDRVLGKEEIDRLSDWKESRFRELITGGIKTLEGVEDLLEDLESAGFSIAVGSSAPRANLDFLLTKAGIAERFHFTVAGEDVKNGKPAPDTFLKAAEKIGLSSDCCVVIEDAVHGVLAAKAAGMKVIAVTNTKARHELVDADIIVDSLTEVNSKTMLELIKA